MSGAVPLVKKADALEQLVTAADRMIQLLRYGMDREPQYTTVDQSEMKIVRRGTRKFAVGVKITERPGRTSVTFGECRAANDELEKALDAARKYCGNMTSVSDLFGLWASIKRAGNQTRALAPDLNWDGCALIMEVGPNFLDAEKAVLFLRDEVKRLRSLSDNPSTSAQLVPRIAGHASAKDHDDDGKLAQRWDEAREKNKKLTYAKFAENEGGKFSGEDVKQAVDRVRHRP